MAFSDYYDASWKSLQFMEQYESHFSAPEPDLIYEYTARHVPGGSRTIIDSTGQVNQEFSLPIACLVADLNAIIAQIGNNGTLVYHAGSLSNVKLVSVRNRKRMTGSEGVYKATLGFITIS